MCMPTEHSGCDRSLQPRALGSLDATAEDTKVQYGPSRSRSRHHRRTWLGAFYTADSRHRRKDRAFRQRDGEGRNSKGVQVQSIFKRYVNQCREYTMSDFEFPDFNPTDHLYRLHSSLASGLYDASRPWPYCDGDLCEWDEFTTLAVCLDFEDMTQKSRPECGNVINAASLDDQASLKCTYTVPKNSNWTSDYTSSRPRPFTWNLTIPSPGAKSTSSRHASDTEFSMKNSWRKNNLLMKARAETREDDETPHTVFDILTVSDDWLSGNGPHETPIVHVYQARFYLCAQTVSNLKLDYTPQGVDVKEPDISVERLYRRKGEEEPSNKDNSTRCYPLDTRPPGRTYFMYDSATWIFDCLNAWFNEVTSEKVTSDRVSSGQDFGKQSFLGIYMYTTGIEQSMRNIATTLSTQLQSNAEGDNMFSTPVPGRAHVLELYFRVRWGWAVIIFVEVTSVAALLAATIHMTSGMPLLKDSVFAFLVHGLEGWGSIRPPQPENIRVLDRIGAEVTARFESGSDGITKFVKRA